MDQEEPIPLSNLVTKKKMATAAGYETRGWFAFTCNTLEYGYCREGKSEGKKDVAFAEIQRKLRNQISFRELTL